MSVRRIPKSTAPAFLAAVLLGAGVAPGGPPAAAAPRPNLVLITVDTLRADRLGCYGNRSVPTPAVDGLAARGVLFSRAFSQASTTLPAHVTILLGMSPPHHGVHDNSNFVVRPEMLTLAEHLKAAGYATGAFVGAFPLDARFGLDQGFDVYDDRLDKAEDRPGEGGERRAEAVWTSARAWLDKQKTPWFLWVHFWDPHDPYAPPEPYLSRFADRPYDGEVAYTDSVVGRLRRHLADRGLDQNTCVVLTGDHGESLGEHGERTHGFLAYNTTMWIPLVVSAPGLAPGRRVRQSVSHADVFPTVCDILGLRAPEGLQGTSLLPAMKGGRLPRRAIYFESLSPYFNMDWAPIQGAIREDEKFIDSPLPEIYDLAADFNEARNIADSGTVSRKRGELRDLVSRLSAGGAERSGRAADRETLERLRSLGYAANVPSAARRTFGPEDDVKTLLPRHNKAMEALDLFKAGKHREAEEMLRETISSGPPVSTAYVNLAFIYRSQGRGDDSASVLRNGLDALPGNYALYSQVLTALYQTGRFEEAVRLFEERRMAQADLDPVIWNYAGLAQWKTGNDEAAREYFEKSAALDRKFAVPYCNLGNLDYFAYRRSRDPERLRSALASYRKALTLDPVYGAASLGLGVALFVAGDTEASIPSLESALKNDPSLHEALYFLGLNHLRRGDRAKACEYFARHRTTPAFDTLSPAERDRVAAIIEDCRKTPGP
jgi:arylsulfatase A-like enzyme/Tfp pilus assembly protein PilF